MKKVFALLMVLVLACALCVPALAAGNPYDADTLKSKIDAADIPADLKVSAKTAVGAMTADQVAAIDVDAVKAITAEAKQAIASETSNTKLANTLNALVDRLETATGVTVKNRNITVDAVNGNIAVSATLEVGNVTITASGTTQAPQIKQQNSGSSSSSDTTSNTAAAASSVIKATGFDTTAVVMVILAIAGVLGAATVKARKLD